MLQIPVAEHTVELLHIYLLFQQATLFGVKPKPV